MIFRLFFSFVFFTLLMGCGRTKQEKVADAGSQSEPKEANPPNKKADPEPVTEKNTKVQEAKSGFKDVVSGEVMTLLNALSVQFENKYQDDFSEILDFNVFNDFNC